MYQSIGTKKYITCTSTFLDFIYVYRRFFKYIKTYQSSLPFLRVWVFDCGEFRIWFNLDEKNKQLLSHLLSNQEKALSQSNGRKLKMRITCLFLHWYWFYKSKTMAGFLHILIAHPMHPCVGELHRATLILLSVFNV